MRTLNIAVCLLLVASVTSYGQEFPEGIKYLGGPGFPDIEDVRDSWKNSLTITDEDITLGFRKDLIPAEVIPMASVRRVTYGQATTRRVGKWLATGIILAPLALFGIFHKSRQHRVLLEWVDQGDRERSILFQVHKDQFVAVLNDLSFRTGQTTYANADDKKWLFERGVNAELDGTPEDKGEVSD
jgi:hypothetical protein